MSEAPKRLWISFADLGDFQPLHIRQWQSTPFAEGTEYISTPIAAGGGEAPAKQDTQEYLLRAMGTNYRSGNLWDHLDKDVVLSAADEIKALRAALSAVGAAEPVQISRADADTIRHMMEEFFHRKELSPEENSAFLSLCGVGDFGRPIPQK